MDSEVIKAAVREYGTPLYLYDGEKMQHRYECLKASLPPGFEIFYSMKANPLLAVCQLFRSLGSGIEVASEGELYLARRAGFEPGRIIFTSPGKTAEEIAFALEAGIYSINIESVEEARIISEMAVNSGRRADVSIRVNPDFNISGAGIKMTGVPSQFGIDQPRLDTAFSILTGLQGINIIGLHVYTGTQVLDAGNIAANMEEIIKLAVDMKERHDFKLRFLDLGGGFGIPYFNGENELDMEKLASGLASVWKRLGGKLAGTRVAVESGRFLTAEAGVYLTKVLYRKENKGVRYLVCDGGSNQHAASAFLGRYVRNNFPMHILGGCGEVSEYNIAGQLCTPTDMIGQKVRLTDAVPGDVLVVEKSGAYGLTDSPAMFLSHPAPAEVICFKGNMKIIRERGRAEDFLRGQKGLSQAGCGVFCNV